MLPQQKPVDLSNRMRGSIPASPIPSFTKKRYATGVAAGAGVVDLLVPNAACIVPYILVQPDSDCTLQLLENGEPVSGFFSIPSGSVWRFAGRLVPNNAKLSLKISNGTNVQFEVPWTTELNTEVVKESSFFF